MSLKDKFHIDSSTWNDMIRSGVISCSVSRAEDILSCLKSKKDSGMSHSEAVKCASLEMGVSEQWVYEVIRRYK